MDDPFQFQLVRIVPVLAAKYYKTDSAEEPHLIKIRQLKTPPKYDGHCKQTRQTESWSVKFSELFASGDVLAKNGGVLRRNRYAGLIPFRGERGTP